MTEPTPDGARRLRVLSVPRQQCEGCGACCSTFRVGPLVGDDIERVMAALPAVREAFPDQDLSAPLATQQFRGAEHTFMAKIGGFCAFHRKGVGCTIHAAVGGAEKPLVCQLFPLQVVETDDGLRAAMRPTCLSDHHAWESGPPIDGAFLQRMLDRPEVAVTRKESAGEAMILRVLSLPEADTGMVLSFLAQRPDPDDPPDVGDWLERCLGRLFAEADAVKRELPDQGQGALHPASLTAQIFGAFRAWSEGDERSARAWPEVAAAAQAHTRDVLRRLVFIRQPSLFPTLPWGLLCYVAAARWASAWADSGESFDQDRYGTALATLITMLESPRLQRSILEAGPPFA